MNLTKCQDAKIDLTIVSVTIRKLKNNHFFNQPNKTNGGKKF